MNLREFSLQLLQGQLGSEMIRGSRQRRRKFRLCFFLFAKAGIAQTGEVMRARCDQVRRLMGI